MYPEGNVTVGFGEVANNLDRRGGEKPGRDNQLAAPEWVSGEVPPVEAVDSGRVDIVHVARRRIVPGIVHLTVSHWFMPPEVRTLIAPARWSVALGTDLASDL